MAYMFVGLDVGKQNDYTALAVFEEVYPDVRSAEHQERHDILVQSGQIEETPRALIQYHLRALERIKLKTDYPVQVDMVKAWLHRLEGNGIYFLVDRGGVGDAVYDMFTGLGIDAIGIRLHGGAKDTPDGSGHSVSKRNLIAAAQVMLQNNQIRVNKRRPPKLWALCRAELEAYQVTISETGQDTYANNPRQQPNDDLVIALSMACWYADYLRNPHGGGWYTL